MAGIPPLIGFFSKQFVLYSAIQNGYYFISIIAILVSVISASYYLKIVKILYTEADSFNQQPGLSNPANSLITSTSGLSATSTDRSYLESKENLSLNITNISSVHSYIISVLTLSILLFILKPSLILNSTQLLSLSLFNW
jgi:NADH-ubiquinone oxidoreductase chain 2